jgi:integrase
MTPRRRADAAACGRATSFSHDVRIWDLRKYESRKSKKATYAVRWVVGGQEHHETFATRALAHSHRAKLLSHAQKGVLFDRATGLPEPMLREQQTRNWYEHVCAYIDMKWPGAAPNSRRSIAETIATVTPVLLKSRRGAPDMQLIRRAMYEWVCVKPKRESGGGLPAELVPVVTWLKQNTVTLATLEDETNGPVLVRQALDALALRLDGKQAAANTIARKRAVFYNVLEYAVELHVLTSNPIDRVRWKAPRNVETVNKRVVVNKDQFDRLLAAVEAQGERGRRLKAFFGCLYYAGFRPAETLDFGRDNLVNLPDEGWGEALLTESNPRAGTAWTDSGRSRERRGLKHRAKQDTRSVPLHPELVKLLRAHLEEFGTGPGGKLFTGPYRGLVAESTYLEVWDRAREKALSAAEYASPLAKRPYDLRHACASTWLNAGVSPTRVATWLGHSVDVLLRVYAKCVDGQEDADRQRIERFMAPPR